MAEPSPEQAVAPQKDVDPDRALLTRLWRDYLAPQRGRLILAFVYMAIYAAATAAYLFVVQTVIDAGADTSVGDYARLILPFIIGIPLISAATNYLQRVATNSISLNAVAAMQQDMFDAALNVDLATLSREPTGTLISRFVSDVGVVGNALIRVVGNLVRDLLSVLFVITAMLVQSWQLSLAMAVFGLALAPLIALSRRMRGSATEAQAHVGLITAQLKESLDGARLIRAYGLEDRERARLGESFTTRIRLFLKLVSQQARVDPILEVLGGLAIAGVLIFGIWMIRQDAVTPGEIVAVLTGLLILAPRLRALGTMNNVVQEMLASLSRVFALADLRSNVLEAPDAIALDNIQGSVELRNVSFAYADGTKALKGVSISAKVGERIALVGPSGGGKSTILNLVPRLFDASEGEVLIDGHNVRSLTLASLRQHIALVSQHVTLFSDTIAENIALGRAGSPRDAIIAAAKAADAHDFINALPAGYDTVLGESGDTLSGGQRQRLSIARAILRDATILLLDEATSALDAESEAKVQAALDRLSEGRTTLVIAHRLATIKGADRVYVIEDGQVTEQGTEAELRQKRGVFARLKALQSD
ncbi:multidrug ABC transporter permease [Algimonas ampicilliniresistens]|uniref:Multidrug ABC transporter permease n=1 Tax=Algimonas ampicilliniresistens TaxID=1298735 RepID=A0ABQ5VCZ1_9PROT|nr:ABC transporter ATP-binding protein [Algimonas ampicilliniresistens]GLQ24827.1 multidrug ABC transporter permease [Algimonas ampicilliniresistens]